MSLRVSLLVTYQRSNGSPFPSYTCRHTKHDHRLRDFMEEAESPFGGLPLFVVGDFFQLPPDAAADSLFSGVVKHIVYNVSRI
ncbi:hypothetical protein OUZ56_012150 [Daphnia magna]|uniref:ATP-dependent DNA helicase n=1 Tax=Daphnia magna TaxID=35525 RepID=A0ABQ9Z2H6_9CRUS|nr:hypothetical protein OUZ56_012150 [Daphnia magna]